MSIKSLTLLVKKYSLYSYPRSWILAVTSFCLILVLFVSSFYLKKRERLVLLEKELKDLKFQSVQFFEKEKEHELLRKKYSNGDPEFLEKTLSQLSFLQKEKDLLEILFSESSFGSYEPMQKRWIFLTSGENIINLKKTFEQQTPQYQETHYKFKHPVEVEKEDIEHILQIVEGEDKNAPQLILKDFFLEKKEEGLYQIDMEIIQRVFHD